MNYILFVPGEGLLWAPVSDFPVDPHNCRQVAAHSDGKASNNNKGREI
jgi:hypothetical protein